MNQDKKHSKKSLEKLSKKYLQKGKIVLRTYSFVCPFPRFNTNNINKICIDKRKESVQSNWIHTEGDENSLNNIFHVIGKVSRGFMRILQKIVTETKEDFDRNMIFFDSWTISFFRNKKLLTWIERILETQLNTCNQFETEAKFALL